MDEGVGAFPGRMQVAKWARWAKSMLVTEPRYPQAFVVSGTLTAGLQLVVPGICVVALGPLGSHTHGTVYQIPGITRILLENKILQ